MSRAISEAGLPQRCKPHTLRKAAARNVSPRQDVRRMRSWRLPDTRPWPRSSATRVRQSRSDWRDRPSREQSQSKSGKPALDKVANTTDKLSKINSLISNMALPRGLSPPFSPRESEAHVCAVSSVRLNASAAAASAASRSTASTVPRFAALPLMMPHPASAERQTGAPYRHGGAVSRLASKTYVLSTPLGSPSVRYSAPVTAVSTRAAQIIEGGGAIISARIIAAKAPPSTVRRQGLLKVPNYCGLGSRQLRSPAHGPASVRNSTREYVPLSLAENHEPIFQPSDRAANTYVFPATARSSFLRLPSHCLARHDLC